MVDTVHLFNNFVWVAANRTDLFIKTTLFCNQTIVFNHGSILAIGPKVFIYPNGTRALFFPPPLGTANRRENCTLESNQSCVSSVGETNCDSCDNGNGKLDDTKKESYQ
jgi:hypothetical protein